MKILIEYIIVFISVLIVMKIINKKTITYELLYLKKIYKIDVKNINEKKLLNTISIVNSFIITTIYIILFYLVKNWILGIIIGVILITLLIIICYGLLGRYYSKERRK